MRKTKSLFFVTGAVGRCLAGGGAAAESKPAVRPNIVVIMADDLGYADLGIQGCKDIPTPNLDALAGSGIRFTNGYVTGALCSPSRAAFITGRHQCRFGHTANPLPKGTTGLDLSQRTIADRLRGAGYCTGLVGKWHLGEIAPYHPLERGFDEFFGFLSGAHSYLSADDEKYGPVLRNHEPVGKLDGYLTDVFGEEACQFIERRKDQPFFLFLSFNAPHSPMQAPAEALDKFADISDPTRRTYAAMVWKMDEAVGRVQQKLRDLKLEKQTLVFFWSDNGGPVRCDGSKAHAVNGSSNLPLRGSKGQLLEGGIRVPFFISWPGVLPSGKVDDRPIVHLDALPTALAAAGISVDPAWQLDGVGLLPFLTGKNSGLPHQRFCWLHHNQFAIRDGQWKLVYWKDERGANPFAGAELYNLAEERGESRDLAAAMPEKVSDLLADWKAWDAENYKRP